MFMQHLKNCAALYAAVFTATAGRDNAKIVSAQCGCAIEKTPPKKEIINDSK